MSLSTERTVVRDLMRFLIDRDFNITGIYDGDEFVICRNIRLESERLGVIFNVDVAGVYVQKGNYNEHWIYIVLGNDSSGVEVVNDWNYTEGDPDGFNAAMEEFTSGLED